MSYQADNTVRIWIEPGREAAYISIPEACDAESLDAQALIRQAQEEGIVVDEGVARRLTELVEQFRETGEAVEAAIAHAVQPKHGPDGYLVWMDGCDPTADDATDNAGDDSGSEDQSDGDADRIDYYNRVQYIKIAEDQHIATIHPPGDGEDGRDVTGEPIPAAAGRPCSIRLHSSVRSDDDGRIYACRNGVLRLTENELKIARTLEVREAVNFSTGNIDFDGTVIVHGDVRDRFSVKATEDVHVAGLIEAASITCGGKFVAHRGMTGKSKGTIAVTGSAEVGYLDEVRGHVQGDLSVQRELLHCHLAVDGALKADEAAMIGGRCIVAGSVSLGVIGSRAATPTTLVLGTVPSINFKLKKLNEMIESLQGDLDTQKQYHDQMQRQAQHLSEASHSQIEQLAAKMQETNAKLEKCENERNRLKRVIQESQHVRVTIQRVAYRQAALQMGTTDWIFNGTYKGPIHVGLNADRELVFRQGNDAERPLTEIAVPMRAAA